MKRLFFFVLLLSLPAFMNAGRPIKTKKRPATVAQLFITAAEKGDIATIDQMLNYSIPQVTKNAALAAAYKNNTARQSDTTISPYTIIIERLLDHGALHNG